MWRGAGAGNTESNFHYYYDVVFFYRRELIGAGKGYLRTDGRKNKRTHEYFKAETNPAVESSLVESSPIVSKTRIGNRDMQGIILEVVLELEVYCTVYVCMG